MQYYMIIIVNSLATAMFFFVHCFSIILPLFLGFFFCFIWVINDPFRCERVKLIRQVNEPDPQRLSFLVQADDKRIT